MLKLLMSFVPGGWIAYAIGAAFSAALVFGAGYKTRGGIDAPIIARAEIAQAKAEKNLSDAASKIDAQIAQNERARADDQTKAREQVDALNAHILQLQSDLGRAQRDRAKTSARLTEELSHAPAGDVRDLGPAALHFLDGVRREQSAANADSHPPTAGGARP